MTVVEKTIKGITYYYYQDSGIVDGKKKVVNTWICRVDLEPKKILDAKLNAFTKHMLKICKIASLIKKTPYHFEYAYNLDEVNTETLNDGLEFLKVIYDLIIKNLSPFELGEFEKELFSKYVHGTTAIEGNTLTEGETHKLLATGLTVPNKTVNETLEVANYNNVREFLSNYTGRVTENMIKQVHRLLMNGISDDRGRVMKIGEYRDSQVILGKVSHTPPPPEAVLGLMKKLLKKYNEQITKNVHPIELASFFHQKFEEIHPFADGNGRVGREILNFVLLKNGFPQIYIKEKQRSDYLTALQKGNEEDYNALFEFIVERINATMQYLYTKTSIYEKLTSEEAKKVAKSLDAEDVHEQYLTIANKYHNSKELP